MPIGASKFARALVPPALLVCWFAGRSRAAVGPPPPEELTPPLDVSVSGPLDVIRDLSARDFAVTLNGKDAPVVSAESHCQTTESEHPRSSTQFFMYFEQNAMSPESRDRAIQIAKTLIPKLVTAGGGVAIVANGKRLRLLVPPTSDGEALLRVLEQLELDENRLKESFISSVSLGSDRAGRLLSMMGAFSVTGPPRVVLYFGDGWVGRRDGVTASLSPAVSGGFRIHTFARGEGSAAVTGLASANGGINFGPTASAASIVERILRSESCLYRLRFERSGVPTNAQLATWVTSTKKKVKVDARDTWYAPTPEMISYDRFAGILAAPLENLEAPGLIVQVIPVGFKRGRYTGLVQVRFDAETAGGSAWEFAARGFRKTESGETLSWRVPAQPSTLPRMFEAEETFSAGPYEIVAVARNLETGEIVARRLEGAMPTVHGTGVAISSIVMMQSGPCDCTRRLDSRPDSSSHAGAFALALGEPVLTDRAVLLVTLVCRGDGDTTKFRVESSLSSGAADDVTRVLADDLEKEGCIQLRDKFAEDELKPGLYTYRVRVLADGQEIETAKRLFAAVAPTTVSPEPAH